MTLRSVFIVLSFALFFVPFAAQAQKVLDVQKLKTPAGVEVWLVEDKTVPVISMSFSFDGGLAFDPPSRPGVARMVSILLDEGAGELDSQAFQGRMIDNAISMEFNVGRDAFYGQIKTLSSNRGLAFDLLRQALTAPRFDADAIDRMRNANIAKIKQDMGNPSWLVARIYNGMAFEGDVYASPSFGTLDSMAKITRKDLANFVRAQFSRAVLRVAIAGDISAKEAVEAVDGIFATLPEKGESPPAAADAVFQHAGKTILYPLDTPQTYVLAGSPGIKRSDKDWHAAVVLNYILGGDGFDSRLMHEMREKRGLTYGVYTSLSAMARAGILQASFSASNDKTEEALSVLRQEWARLAKEGPTAEELEDAKSYLTGSLLLGLTSTEDISNTLNSFQRDGLDAGYINQRNGRILAVTSADIRRVSSRLLKTDALTTVLVGRPQNVSADIMLDSPPGMAAPKP